MSTEFNLDDGLAEIVKRVGRSSSDPALVSVYGLPNSGKSYLIRKIFDYFNKSDWLVFASGGWVNESVFHSQLSLIDELSSEQRSLCLFHCGCELFMKDGVVLDSTDPNNITKKRLNRGIDINVGIYNPEFEQLYYDFYDLKIVNPDSFNKYL